MKQLFFTLLFVISASAAFSQAKKPTIMIVPSKDWMDKNGYMMKFENQGKIDYVPNYELAFVKNSDLKFVIGKIGELMVDRGFPLEKLESAIDELKQTAAEDAMLTSKESKADIQESPIDKLAKVAKADIWIEMGWTINSTGPKKSITFRLEGIDAYTNKQIAGASGTGQPSFTSELPVLLEEAVLSHLDNFNSQLQKHFDKLFVEGREVTLRILTFSSWEHNLESEDFGEDGDELRTIIENWVSDNTVGGRFNLSTSTENLMLFKEVKIPLFDEKGKAMATKNWADNLRKHLKKQYGIDAKIMQRGLGQAQLVLGEK
jgi:hypothetical protein